MKITLSKSQWEKIGKKTGWIKSAKAIAELTPQQIQEDIGRLEKIAAYLKEIGNLMEQTRAQENPMVEEGNFLMGLYSGVRKSIRNLQQALAVKLHAKNEKNIKVAQNLETVKTPEKFTERELTRAIRDAIIAEEGAVKQYETVVDATDNSTAKEVLQDISNEEKVHVGELQALLKELLKDEQGFLDDGAKEVADKK